jgi:hypothetical protein
MWEFDGRTYGYVIQVSPDNVLWTTVVDKRSNTNTAQTQQDAFTPRSARYVRIMITQLSAGCWASFWEFRVLASPLGGIEKDNEIPREMELEQNYPNPFNPKTTVKYAMARDTKVTIQIYNLLGQRIRTLIDSDQTAGYKSIDWDGANNDGIAVCSGVYFYQMKAEDFVSTKKMLLLK